MLCLIVEDEPVVARTLGRLLAAEQYESVHALSAQDGLDLLRTQPIELVLLDVNLPGGLSGYAACEAYKSLRPRVPILLMTGAYTSEADARLSRAVGAADFLKKPFSASTLLEAVRRSTAAAAVAPPAQFAFHCEECGAEGRSRELTAEARRVRCPNCGSIRALCRAEQEPVTAPRVPRLPDALRRRILAVDSAEHFRLYLLDVLTEAGHYVVTARDGREALRLAKEWLPDLVVTDILVPGLDGIALCREIRNDPQLGRTPVVVLTNLKSQEYPVYAEEAGAALFLTKPIQATDFVERLTRLIAGLDD
jgi:DNA-binding response OmpR family regulator